MQHSYTHYLIIFGTISKVLNLKSALSGKLPPRALVTSKQTLICHHRRRLFRLLFTLEYVLKKKKHLSQFARGIIFQSNQIDTACEKALPQSRWQLKNVERMMGLENHQSVASYVVLH